MANRTISRIAVLAVDFLVILPFAVAQRGYHDVFELQPANHVADTAFGIRTDRLTPGQLEIWRSMEQLVLAAAKDGSPTHSELNRVWQSAQRSNCAIYIELPQRSSQCPYCAGIMQVEEFDAQGNAKTAVIQLNLATIDSAPAVKEAKREEGFIPFEGLNKTARYVEVLGHELTHVTLILENPKYAHLYGELRTKMAERALPTGQGSRKAELKRSQQWQDLVNEIEKPAYAAEFKIWRELRTSPKKRGGDSPRAGHSQTIENASSSKY